MQAHLTERSFESRLAPVVHSWRRRDGNDPSVDIAKDATTGFEVRRRIVRQHSGRFASVRFEVDGRGREFAVVRRRSPKFAGVAISVAVKQAAIGCARQVDRFAMATSGPRLLAGFIDAPSNGPVMVNPGLFTNRRNKFKS